LRQHQKGQRSKIKSNYNKMTFIKKYKIHIVWALVVIVAFVGGLLVGKMGSGSRQFAGAPNGGSFGSARGTSGARTGGGFVSGTIMAISGQNITLQLPNGSSEVVFYSSSTSVIKPTVAPVSNLVVGTNVMIGGTTNPDGSLTAQSIQIRTAGSAPAMGSGAGAGSRPSSDGSQSGQ